MTFNQILTAIYRRTNYDDVPDVPVVTRISQWVNIWHQRILAKPGLEDLRDTTFTFTSVASQTTYALPQGLTRIDQVFEATTPRSLQLTTLGWIRQYDPQLTAVGTPDRYAVVSASQVMLQPVATGVWVASTSASDTTQLAHIEGLRTGGYRSGDIAVLLTGTTRVQLGTYTDYIDLDKAYVSATGAGVISFYDAAVAGNELARVSIGQTSQRDQTLFLWPVPQAVITYSVDGKRVIEDMVNPADVPSLPLEFHWLLIEAGSFEEWTRKSDQRAKIAMTELTDGIKDLRNWVTNLPDYRPRAGDGQDARPSRLGGQYPAW